MSDNLEHFLRAQEQTYTIALNELRAGKKVTHWMWFIFPQLLGLGRSEMAAKFGIRDRRQALEYLRHDILGPRLYECSRAVVESGVAPSQIFGPVDYRKFVSCMTLFSVAAGSPCLFGEILARTSAPDRYTLQLLGELQ